MFRFFALAIALSATFCAHGTTADDYATLLAKLQAGDPAVDFHALRMAHAASPDYRPNSPDSLIRRKAVQDAIESKAFDQAAPLLEKWLSKEPLNPFAHLGAIRVYKELGDEQKSAFHDAVVDGIFRSICQVDEGYSPNRPCRVLSIDEQHFYLVMQGLVIDGDYGTLCRDERPCQVYEATKLNTNSKHTLYFDISLPLAYQDAQRKAKAAAAQESAQKP
jgi:hypothetical protein